MLQLSGQVASILGGRKGTKKNETRETLDNDLDRKGYKVKHLLLLCDYRRENSSTSVWRISSGSKTQHVVLFTGKELIDSRPLSFGNINVYQLQTATNASPRTQSPNKNRCVEEISKVDQRIKERSQVACLALSTFFSLPPHTHYSFPTLIPTIPNFHL